MLQVVSDILKSHHPVRKRFTFMRPMIPSPLKENLCDKKVTLNGRFKALKSQNGVRNLGIYVVRGL